MPAQCVWEYREAWEDWDVFSGSILFSLFSLVSLSTPAKRAPPFWTPIRRLWSLLEHSRLKTMSRTETQISFFYHEGHEGNKERHSSQRITLPTAVIRWLLVLILCPFEYFVDNNAFHFPAFRRLWSLIEHRRLKTMSRTETQISFFLPWRTWRQ